MALTTENEQVANLFTLWARTGPVLLQYNPTTQAEVTDDAISYKVRHI